MRFQEPEYPCHLYLFLVSSVCGCQGGIAAAWCMWLEHPYSEEC